MIERQRQSAAIQVATSCTPWPICTVIGASVGGLDGVRQLVEGVPERFSAPVFVVVHVPPDKPSLLPAILSRAGK